MNETPETARKEEKKKLKNPVSRLISNWLSPSTLQEPPTILKPTSKDNKDFKL